MYKSDQITIKDIAKALGLSYSSVSRALKGSHQISEATTQRVKEYAEAHNYKPNLMAQSLKNKQSHCIGIIISSIPNNFFAEVISGIESVASSNDYLIIITQSNESYEKEIQNLENLTWRSVDGLIVSVSSETRDVSHLKKVHDMGLPMVFFDRITDDIETHQVLNDNERGAFEATHHLISNGYTKVAQVTSAPYTSITQERLAGYTRALKQNGLPFNKEYVKYCMHGGLLQEEIDAALSELLALPEPPDALVLASDRITLKSMSYLQQKEINIPDEMGVVGFTNFSAPELLQPALTTVSQPAFEIGRTAAELLLKLIESKRPVKQFQKTVLQPELIVRSSSVRNKKVSKK